MRNTTGILTKYKYNGDPKWIVLKIFLALSEKREHKKKQVQSLDESIKIDLKIGNVDEDDKPLPNKDKKNKINTTSLIASQILLESENIPSFQDMPHSGFVGAFNYVPEPSMFEEGAEYRNKNNGTVYKKVGNLWEEYIRDGKNGVASMSVGGGCGVNEVKSIANQLASETLFLLSSQTEQVVSANAVLKSMSSEFNSIILYAEGPSAGTYYVSVKFYTIVDGVIDLVATSNLTNTSNKDNAQILTSNKVWFATLDINSGTVPAPGILAKVMR